MIQKYYEKFLTLFKNKSYLKDTASKDELCQLNFILNKNLGIHTEINIRENTNLDPTYITILAEKIAEFIIFVNNGHLNDNIINRLILQKKHNIENPDYCLLIDNIKSFYVLLNQSNINLNKKNDSVLIKPSEVFKNP